MTEPKLMSFTVTDAFVQQFSGNVRHLAQQMNARLRGKVLEDQIHGEAAYVEQLAPTTARKRTTRHGDSPVNNIQHLRRRVAAYPYEAGDLVDQPDKVRLLIDPESSYAQALAMAMRRGQDDEVIAATFGTAYTGHTGATAVQWPNGNNESSPTAPAGTVVALNSWAYGTGTGNSGLTISKLIEAKMALDAIEGDEDEDYYICLPAAKIGDLLSTTEVTDANYNTVRALVDGKVDTFMGFRFIRSQRIQKDASGNWRVMAWRKSGLAIGIVTDIYARMAERPDKSFSMYVYARTDIGGARIEEGKVAEIICLP